MSNLPVPETAVHPAQLAIENSMRYSKVTPAGEKTIERAAGWGSPAEIILRVGSKIAKETHLLPKKQTEKLDRALWRSACARAGANLVHESADSLPFLETTLNDLDPMTVKVRDGKGAVIPMRTSTGFTGQEIVQQHLHMSPDFPILPSGELVIGGTPMSKDQLQATIYGHPDAKLHPQYEILRRSANANQPELVVRLPFIDRNGTIHLVALNREQFNRLQTKITA